MNYCKLLIPTLQFEADAEDDPKRLQQLFRVSQAVMQVKAAQAEVAMEELEKKETKSVKFSTRKG